MEKLIQILDLYHTIHHPLSWYIVRKFEDRNGCSKNGGRGFLFEAEIINNRRAHFFAIHGSLIRVDYRGVPYIIYLKFDFDKFQDVILRWRTCTFQECMSEDTPLIEEEEACVQTLIDQRASSDRILSLHMLEPIVKWDGFKSLGGHVLGINWMFAGGTGFREPGEHPFEILARLPKLRSVRYRFGSHEDNSGLHRLSNLHQLKMYSRDWFEDDSIFIHDMQHFTRLNSLNMCFYTCGKIMDIDYISHLTQLSELQLCDFKLSEDKFPDWMWTFTRLTTFLTQEFDIGPLPVPMGVTNLVHLNNWEIGCMKFTGEFPMEICKMEKFVQLRIRDTEITNAEEAMEFVKAKRESMEDEYLRQDMVTRRRYKARREKRMKELEEQKRMEEEKEDEEIRKEREERRARRALQKQKEEEGGTEDDNKVAPVEEPKEEEEREEEEESEKQESVSKKDH